MIQDFIRVPKKYRDLRIHNDTKTGQDAPFQRTAYIKSYYTSTCITLISLASTSVCFKDKYPFFT